MSNPLDRLSSEAGPVFIGGLCNGAGVVRSFSRYSPSSDTQCGFDDFADRYLFSECADSPMGSAYFCTLNQFAIQEGVHMSSLARIVVSGLAKIVFVIMFGTISAAYAQVPPAPDVTVYHSPTAEFDQVQYSWQTFDVFVNGTIVTEVPRTPFPTTPILMTAVSYSMPTYPPTYPPMPGVVSPPPTSVIPPTTTYFMGQHSGMVPVPSRGFGMMSYRKVFIDRKSSAGVWVRVATKTVIPPGYVQ